jgi:hypothetical protein
MHGDHELARTAALYVDGLREMLFSPNEYAAGVLNIPKAQVRDRIRAARKRGLLTAAEPGKRGGALTEKAREILNIKTPAVCRRKAREAICPVITLANKDSIKYDGFSRGYIYKFEMCRGCKCAFWSYLGAPENNIGNCGISKFMQILEDK